MVSGLRCRFSIQGSGFRDLGFSGFGFKVQIFHSGFRVLGSGFRFSGLGI